MNTPTKPARTASDCIKRLEAAGWTTELGEFDEVSDYYRATQGNFSTPWLESWEKVLAWIEGSKEAK